MRVRYSMRLLLATTTVVAIGLYVLFSRPTAIANRFIEAVERHDFDAAQSLCTGIEPGRLRKVLEGAVANDLKVKAVLIRRQSKDTWALQRSLLLQLRPALSGNQQAAVGYQCEPVATIWGVKNVAFVPRVFGP